MAEKIKEHKPLLVAFDGDLLDSPYSIETPALSLASKCIKLLQSAMPHDSILTIIMGNHDLYEKKGTEKTTTLEWLKGYQKVAIVDDKPISTPPFCFIPYMRDGKKFIEACTAIKTKTTPYLICHQPINKLKFNAYKEEEDGVILSNIPFSEIFTGHYHVPQDTSFGKKKLHVSGALLPFNFSDDTSNIGGPFGAILVELTKKARGFRIDSITRLVNPECSYFCTYHVEGEKVLPSPMFEGGDPIPPESTHLKTVAPA